MISDVRLDALLDELIEAGFKAPHETPLYSDFTSLRDRIDIDDAVREKNRSALKDALENAEIV